jgi:hypothetical protein
VSLSERNCTPILGGSFVEAVLGRLYTIVPNPGECGQGKATQTRTEKHREQNILAAPSRRPTRRGGGWGGARWGNE